MQTRPAISLKLRQVRTAMTEIQPFFAAIGFQMETIPDPTVKTGTADGRVIRFNPEWFEKLDFDHAVGWLAQKSFQCAAKHHLRMIGRDSALANMASQYVANPEVLSAGYKLPPGHLINPDFKGMSFERVYNMLDAMREQSEQQQPQPDQEDDPNAIKLPASGDDESDQDASQGDAGEGDGEGDDKGEGDDDQGGDGSGGGADGESDSEDSVGAGSDGGGGAASASEDQSDYGGCGSIQQPRDPNGNAPDTNLINEQTVMWDTAVREAEMIARRIGDLPGASYTLSQSLNEGRQDWRSVMRRFLWAAVARNYSWNIPDRRFATQPPNGTYSPSLHSKRMARLGIASDTSASVMTAAQIQIITDEMNSLLVEICPQQTTVVYCDTEVQHVDEYTPQDYPIELNLAGGGGTRCSPIFEWFDENGTPPIALIIFTDLEINDFPTEEPPYPVLWASTLHREAPFGEVVMMDEI